MKDYLREQVGLTLAAMSGQMPTELEAIESAVVRAETKARNVVDFREAADFYCADNPDYQFAKLRRIYQYLREERVFEDDWTRWVSLYQAQEIVTAVIQMNFGEEA